MSDLQQLATWLNDAHAMETSLIQVLETHARAAEALPEVRAQFEQHLAETHGHAVRVAQCLRLLGQEPSLVKDTFAKGMGRFEGMATGMYRDELLKNFLMDYAAESMEIACYTALIAAAEDAGQLEIAKLCAEILDEEIEMAAWIEEQIPIVTRQVLHAVA